MFKRGSIRLKLTICFSLALIAVTAITFLTIRLASGVVLRATIRDYLVGTVEANTHKIRYVSQVDDPSGNLYLPWGENYLEVDLDFMDVVNDVHTALYTADGKLLYGKNPLARRTQTIPFSTSRIWQIEEDGVTYQLYDCPLLLHAQEPVNLWIRGIVPATQSVQQLQSITRLSLLILPVLILLAALSAYLVADRLLSPIRRMEQTVGQITRGDDLHRRVDESGRGDEVGRLARAFNHMLDRLERSFEAERQFTSDVSHELRTPTAVILAQSEYTLERQRTPAEYTEAMEVIHRQSQRMSQLIGDMLDYTRMDQQSQRYPLETLDFSRLVAEATQQQAQLAESRITLTTDIPPAIPLIGNQLLLSRLVQNLVENACRYGKPDGHVQVALTETASAITLTVADDGIGIPPEEQERIFDRFYRADASRSLPGTGLGLSMVQKIAQIHGAIVHLDSVVGRGSTFTISFPKKI